MDSIRKINPMEKNIMERKKMQELQNKIMGQRSSIGLTKGVTHDIRKRQFIRKGILGLIAGIGIAAFSKIANARYFFADGTSQAAAAAGLTEATQSDMEDEGTTATDRYVSPEVGRYGPYTCKAFCLVNGAGALQSGSYNVSGSTKDSTGRYTVSWDTDFADAIYTMIACVNETTACGTAVTDRLANITTAGKVATYNNAAPHVLSDLPFYVAAWGAQ